MVNNKINKVLIANRGEIALRVKRACEKLGIKAVGVCSEVDRTAYFARQFEEIIVLGAPQPHESYLNIDKLIKAAKDTGADAIHPGYGFLSENAEFASRVLKEGLIFIGPSPESIEILGDKTKARERVQKFKVPCVPGSDGGLSDEALMKRAEEIGFPIIIKAAAGGGGRGMRVIESLNEMKEILPRARGEAKKNFGSDEVFIEKYIINPRHVEVQIFGDTRGKVLHFGTRDCSAQRRHQKIIEEAPAPNLDPKLREAIHEAAVRAAESVGYYNAGTAEFLVSGDSFYFLEMNTRIQVEHPVTEEVAGVDLVELQLRIARGEALPMTQSDVMFKGHAIEFRVYAEDPENNFSPSIGKIASIEWKKKFPWIREEFGFTSGDHITPYYDAMIAKIIVTAETRELAIDRGYEALRSYEVKGLKTNIDFERWILLHKPFRKGELTIQDIEKHFSKEKLAELRAREVTDTKHKAPVGECEHKELLNYQSAEFGAQYTIEVLHKRDGTFVAVPLSTHGARAPSTFWRRSNGFNAVVESITKDVLEKISPDTLFASSSD